MSLREYEFSFMAHRATTTLRLGAAAVAFAFAGACGSDPAGMPATQPPAPTMASTMATATPTGVAGRGMMPAPPPVTPPATATAGGASGGAAGTSPSMAAAGAPVMAGGAGMSAAAGGAGGAGMAMGTLGGPLMYTDEFTKGTTVPSKYKCPMPIGGGMGDNISPPLAWTGGPADTKSYAIVLFDVMFNMFHWAIWDIPVGTNKLPEAGVATGYELMDPMGAHQFGNGSDDHQYYGPCSSAGGSIVGTYQYRLYALNTDKLDLTMSSTAMAIQSAIDDAMTEMVMWEGQPE
jgi:Raf kinase inhibitor-like YbhB/YbcL family protein